MKFERIGSDGKYGDYLHVFKVNYHKSIHIYTEKDHSITDIYLVDASKNSRYLNNSNSFHPSGLWYIENITDDEGALDVDSMMIMIAQEEHGCVRA